MVKKISTGFLLFYMVRVWNINLFIFPVGERDYGPPIDLWGGGCIMAEMWTRSPIMQGNTEQHQLTLISQLCGSITAEVRSLDLSCHHFTFRIQYVLFKMSLNESF